MKPTISKLPHEERCGDWHDKPLRWSVNGPDNEVQKFSTKRDAMKYASIRHRSADFNSATREYCAS